MTKVIILDRDGVINHDSDEYIKSPSEWIPISGSLEAIAQLNNAGYKVAIATNQSGVARGFYNLATLKKMHIKMQGLLAKLNAQIDYIAYCPHGPNEGCSCRKPKAGMLLEIADFFSEEPEEITFVGDSSSDMQAAKAANMKFVLVKTGKGEKTMLNESVNKKGEGASYSVYDSLQDFVNTIVKVS
ncbi:MAG TPA: D-glycero-beta-D-manno-heptose 1,7-bisphosphate 7-phosphatase [Leucothrix sp.]|nr:D-glycero-beta-D-manno-heptose 1,7-bisphosphate 7-phosphatase [Leucothrix sp.]